MARTGADVLELPYAQKMRILAHADQNGRRDGQQIMAHRGGIKPNWLEARKAGP
jgi:hypothetical protein